MTKAETLERILNAVQADACYGVLSRPSILLQQTEKLSIPEAIEKILTLIMECVPGECKDEDFVLLGTRRGFNLCRDSMFKNLDELRYKP